MAPRAPEHTMTPLQCRLARTAVNWTKEDLAARTELSVMTISRFELCYQGGARGLSAWKMQAAFERAGVVFGENRIDYPAEWNAVVPETERR
ncbi:MAG: helix-turn-helix transcriptional regulator [Rhodomicrobium sp.]